jgi:hypothetical protein
MTAAAELSFKTKNQSKTSLSLPLKNPQMFYYQKLSNREQQANKSNNKSLKCEREIPNCCDFNVSSHVIKYQENA